ncbi:MAG: hypothetical protein ACKPKO_03470, partial [Candidatus Fonsibacter sp.]
RKNETRDVIFKNQDASTQTDVYDCYENWTNQEIDDMLARRLNNPFFQLTNVGDTMLVRDYNRRSEYKSAGASYNGSAKAWFVLAGDDVRPFIMHHPEWVVDIDVVYRRALMTTLRRLEEIDRMS